MPDALSYPGVYTQEVPSGLRVIKGVASSITAFVGTALQGPVGLPMRIQGEQSYQQTFGPLSPLHPMGYSVAHFFANGGIDAIIVRVVSTASARPATVSAGSANDLPLQAANPGAWGAQLSVRIDHNTRPIVGAEELFNLQIRNGATGTIERHLNVSVLPTHPRYVVRVLAETMALARLQTNGVVAASRPGAHTGTEDQVTEATAWEPFTGGVDGGPPTTAQFQAGLDALLPVDLVNLIVVPPVPTEVPGTWADVPASVAIQALDTAIAKRAMYLQDPPADWTDVTAAVTGMGTVARNRNTAMYWPRIMAPDPLVDGRLAAFAPSGAIAGLMARTDASRGVWKAPAGIEANLMGVTALEVTLTDQQTGILNSLGLNTLRSMPFIGPVVWGARTLDGADALASEWKYVPVRRMALFLQESLLLGSQWAVLEQNDERLWAQIRMTLGTFLHGLFRQGAFVGNSAREAYFIKCGRETTTRADKRNGIVNIEVGFAPLRPAEFVVLKLQQTASQSAA